MTTTVTKLATNRFAVEGVIAVIGGRIVNEEYCRVHTSRNAAEADAAKLNRQNVEALAELSAYTEARHADVSSRLAARNARRAAATEIQSSFNF